MSLIPHAPRLVVLLVNLALLTAGAAEGAELARLDASLDGQAVSVEAVLDDAFRHDEARTALQNGVPIIISFELDLIRKRENWFDAVIASTEIEMVATYNSLTREYLLNYRRDRKLVSSESIRSFEELQRRMSHVGPAPLFQSVRTPSRSLRVRARAILARRYLLHVIPRPVATDWRVTRVSEAP